MLNDAVDRGLLGARHIFPYVPSRVPWLSCAMAFVCRGFRVPWLCLLRMDRPRSIKPVEV